MFVDHETLNQFGKYFLFLGRRPFSFWKHPHYHCTNRQEERAFNAAIRDGAILPCLRRPWYFLHPALSKSFGLPHLGLRSVEVLRRGPAGHEAMIFRVAQKLRGYENFFEIALDESLGVFRDFNASFSNFNKIYPDIFMHAREFGVSHYWIECERRKQKSYEGYLRRVDALREFRVIYVVPPKLLSTNSTFVRLREESRALVFDEHEFEKYFRGMYRRLLRPKIATQQILIGTNFAQSSFATSRVQK